MEEAKELTEKEYIFKIFLEKFEDKNYKIRLLIASYLKLFAENNDSIFLKKIISLLINSRYVVIRRKGYKLVPEVLNPNLIAELENVWKLHTDHELTKVIVNRFPLDFLVSNYDFLLEAIEEDWLISKLFLKLSKLDDLKYINAVKDINPISYCYICAKNKININLTDAMAIIDRNLENEKIGLVLWSFGKLKMWDALVYYHNAIIKYYDLKKS